MIKRGTPLETPPNAHPFLHISVGPLCIPDETGEPIQTLIFRRLPTLEQRRALKVFRDDPGLIPDMKQEAIPLDLVRRMLYPLARLIRGAWADPVYQLELELDPVTELWDAGWDSLAVLYIGSRLIANWLNPFGLADLQDQVNFTPGAGATPTSSP